MRIYTKIPTCATKKAKTRQTVVASNVIDLLGVEIHGNEIIKHFFGHKRSVRMVCTRGDVLFSPAPVENFICFHRRLALSFSPPPQTIKQSVEA